MNADQLAGGLMGLLIGDAVGVPYEFNAPTDIPPIAHIDLHPPTGYRRTYPDIPPGTWSDDGAQALCLLASLLDCDRLDPDDLGQRFLRWYTEGYFAVDRHVFDVGNQTAKALNAIQSGMPVLQAGQLGKQAKGNGSLMRSLPLTLWHPGSDAELVADAHLQSQTTHGQITCQVCCALYCLWARQIAAAIAHPWEAAVATLRQLYTAPHYALYLQDLEETIRPDQPPGGEGSGYVVDCLHSARWVMQSDSYVGVVKQAIALGNDTDTTACVAGGLAGLRDGLQAIPEEWRSQLRGQDLVQPLLERLVERWRG
ncbi:MAG: ADP-ribosylglycohydrolase family protein [Oculatellaceae cyanobacterium Prado106]|nr:ADP-ribosylglycohydrolase family protein [Oculatellaceae cyanobacterium Prado106]